MLGNIEKSWGAMRSERSELPAFAAERSEAAKASYYLIHKCLSVCLSVCQQQFSIKPISIRSLSHAVVLVGSRAVRCYSSPLSLIQGQSIPSPFRKIDVQGFMDFDIFSLSLSGLKVMWLHWQDSVRSGAIAVIVLLWLCAVRSVLKINIFKIDSQLFVVFNISSLSHVAALVRLCAVGSYISHCVLSILFRAVCQEYVLSPGAIQGRAKRVPYTRSVSDRAKRGRERKSGQPDVVLIVLHLCCSVRSETNVPSPVLNKRSIYQSLDSQRTPKSIPSSVQN